jgi:predicted SAM-dependent methyltransferase
MPELLIEAIAAAPPYGREEFVRHGLRGLNCGCGRMLRPGCLNVDQIRMVDARGRASEPGQLLRVNLDGQVLYYLQHDLTQAFPVANHSFSWGYSEHFIEHVTPEQAVAWLAEMRRLIAPGGLLRVTTPDLKKYIEGYSDPEGKFFRLHTERMEAFTGNKGSVPQRRAWMVNQIFRFFKHQWIYDFDELRHAASLAGFDPDGIVREAYQTGLLEDVAMLDSPERNDETLYVEMLI